MPPAYLKAPNVDAASGADRYAERCTGKVRFERPDLAAAVAERHAERAHYRCPACNGWHVGTLRKYLAPWRRQPK